MSITQNSSTNYQTFIFRFKYSLTRCNSHVHYTQAFVNTLCVAPQEKCFQKIFRQLKRPDIAQKIDKNNQPRDNKQKLSMKKTLLHKMKGNFSVYGNNNHLLCLDTQLIDGVIISTLQLDQFKSKFSFKTR